MREQGVQVMHPDEIPKHTLRLTFTYDQSDVHLEDSRRVEMIAPLGEPELIQQGRAGFWVELRDADEHILYQQALAGHPMRRELEVFDDPETGSIRRQRIDDPQGTFELLVPDIPEAQALVLFSSPPEAMYKSAAELTRFSLDVARQSTETNS
jgi:hypothetical protein